MIDERIKRILLAIIKHCDVIEDTKKYFGNDYVKFEDNSIPWRNIAGMRDIVVHNYETIDKLILWNVADKETIKIREFCKRIIN